MILEKRQVKGARILSFISTLIIILTFAMLVYVGQSNSGMVTAMATIILVVITGFYAWNTHIQVGSMDEQANLIRNQANIMSEQVAEMHSQTEIMKGQFDLAAKSIKRDKIEKEMDLLILPLKTIYMEINIRGINSDWWDLYTGKRITSTDIATYDKFHSAVYSIDQNKYLAPINLHLLINEFIIRLKDMKGNRDAQHKELLIKATKDLYYKEDSEGGLVEERSQELTAELRTLEIT